MVWNVTDANGEVFVVNHDDISDWADIRFEPHDGRGHEFVVYAHDTGLAVGRVRFILDFPESDILTVSDLVVEPDFQGRGVALALLATLHAAYPGHRVNPGAASEVGRSFSRHIIATEPVAAATAIMAHPSLADLLTPESESRTPPDTAG